MKIGKKEAKKHPKTEKAAKKTMVRLCWALLFAGKAGA